MNGTPIVARMMRELKDDPIHVLLVDDDILSAKFLMTCLTRCNCVVRHELTPDNVLKILEQSDFDLVLVDIHLPGACGIELMRSIRKQDAAQKAAFISGAVNSREMDEIQQLGFAGFINKQGFLENIRGALAQMGLR